MTLWQHGRRVEPFEQGVAFGTVHADNMIGEGRVDIKAALAGFWMGPHNRMLLRRKLFAQFRRVFVEPFGKDARNVVYGGHLAQFGLQSFRQAFKRQCHIRKQSVPAHVGQFDGAQDGPERGLGPPCDIGMPEIFLAATARPVGDAQDFAVRLVFGCGRMDLELAKSTGERNMLGAGDVLIAEEDDFVAQQSGADLGNQPIVKCAKIDIKQFCPDGWGQLAHCKSAEKPC